MMSEHKCSLDDLKLLRAAMSRGAWKYDNVNGTIEAPKAGPNQFLGKSVCEMYIANAEANAAGIVATHNAADVLIEIAEAALDLESHTVGTRTRKAAYQRLLAALAKITP